MIGLGLDGARAIVVGAGFIPYRAGPGRGSGLRLAAAGATVACVDMDEGRASEIAAEIQQAGGKAFAVVGDVRTEAEARRIIDEAVAGLGGVDVLVDVVGEAIFAPPRPMDIANSALSLSSSLAARVTGQTLVVDGGATTRSVWGQTEQGLAAFKASWREERN